MRRLINPGLIFSAIFFAGCGNSFFSAQNYLTGPVNGVGLKPTTSIVSQGTEQLSPVVAPPKTANQNVIWSTDNAAVATVDANGLVTATVWVTDGMPAQIAHITVTTVEGNFSATCTVTVVKKPVSVTGVTLNKSVSYISTLTSPSPSPEQLTATVIPSTATNQGVTWSSDNQSVATVSSNGLVTGISDGIANITVTTSDGGFTASCQFHASTASTPVTSVSLNKSGTTIAAGYSETLFATIAPVTATNQNVTWSSSNSTIATVDTLGNVTGKAAGSTTITATTVDGGHIAQCTVSVVPTVIPVTGVSLSSSAISVQTGNQQPLTATIAPANATNQNLVWKSSNSAVASVDSGGNVTGVSAGSATITVTADGGFSQTCAVTVTPTATYTVTYNAGGGSGNVPGSSSYPANSTVIVQGNTGSPAHLSYAGYTFSGWKNGTTTYQPGDTFQIGSANVTLTAVWTLAPAFSIVYVANGSTGGNAPTDSNTYITGATATVLGEGTLHGPSIIAGISQRVATWNTQSNGTGTSYSPGSSLTMGTSVVILYAQWTTDSNVLGKIGPGGGWVFHDAGTLQSDADGNWQYMEAAPVGVADLSLSTNAAWSTNLNSVYARTSPPLPTGLGTGRTNTDIIVANDSGASAARLCRDYRGGGKSDWFLPSYDEFIKLASLSVGGGFTIAGLTWDHHTSSEYSATADYIVWVDWGNASYQTFYYGKATQRNVRPIRAF